MTDYKNLSENELKALIERAETALKQKQANKRKEIIAKIKELAASIDLTLDINEDGKKMSKTSRKIPIKYQHPSDPDKTWTGRGMTPKWLQELMTEGRDRSEFKV